MRRLAFLFLLAAALPAARAEEIPVEDMDEAPAARATALPPDASVSVELLDMVFYEIRTAEEMRQLLLRDRVARAIRADTLLLRVLHDRLVHPTVAEATGRSLEDLETIHRAILRNPRRPPRGVRLGEILLLEIPRLESAYAPPPAPARTDLVTGTVSAPPAPSSQPPGRWTRWGWVQSR